MNSSNKKYPKTFPFKFDNDPSQAANEPPSQPNHSNNHHQSNGYPSERGMLNVAMFLIGTMAMGSGLTAGAWVGYRILVMGLANVPLVELIAGTFAAGLAYVVGWVVGLFGIRVMGNFILPFIMKAFAWLTLAGLSVLQIAIIVKLFNQNYNIEKFILYVTMFSAGLIALIGIHLLIEDHSLALFSFPILIISLTHLFVIVLHYAFIRLPQEKYIFLWGDAIFFFITSLVGVLMLAHLGVLEGFRKSIGETFSQNTIRLVPPE
jgi:hypothetical protein